MDDAALESLTSSLQTLAEDLGSLPHAEHVPLLLALDQGGHASRALVFDIHGRKVTQAYAPITTQRTGEDCVEHDASEVLDSLRTVIDDVAYTLGADIDRLVAAGLATQRSSIVCWDAIAGTPLSPVLSWQDRRNVALINQLQSHRNEIQQLTGLVLSPHYGASKLRWCLDELPAVRQACDSGRLQCGPLASFLLHGLLNEKPHVVDPANASRTQLWTPATRDWSPRLLDWFGVPLAVLPRSVTTRDHYGSLRVGAQHVALQVCTGDQAAVPFAAGALRDDAVYLNLGTGAFVLAPLQQDIVNAAPLLRSVLYSDDQQVRYALEGTVNGAGSALQWLNERSGIDIERAIPVLQRAQLTHVEIPLFINGVGGVGSPYWLPQVVSRFITTPNADKNTHSDLAEVAAVIESIAFLLADNIALMRLHLPRLNHIVAGGGLSTCRYLCECIASLTGLPLTRIREPELTAKGLAFLLAGESVAELLDWQIDYKTVEFVPQPDHSLSTRYVAWQQAMSAL